jgi:poly-gamma-glutamate capsule biosynthesis protein CapA/YwtB (metallophosphatase superfamily)
MRRTALIRLKPVEHSGDHLGAVMHIALTGDVMLGRGVDDYVMRTTAVSAETVWGDVLPLLLAADCRAVNLECVISSRGREWNPETKAFHFRAHPRAIEVLQAARIDGVTLANNHSLDYGAEALAECLALLDRAGIRHAGAGMNLEAALTPAVLHVTSPRVAVIALTDNEPAWEATRGGPGVNYVDYNSRGMTEPYRSRMKEAISEGRRRADFLIVSAHVGPNWGAPSLAMQALAHDLLDLGADLYWGHSNHTPQGVEIYYGKVILYSTGDFIDDYAVDPAERNDLSFLFVLEFEQGRVQAVRLYPVAIEHCRVRLARAKEAAFLDTQMRAKCAAFRTKVQFHNGQGMITPA